MTPPENAEPTIAEQLGALSAFLRRTLRFWPVVLVSLVAGGIAFAAFHHFRQPRYRSETVILYVEKGNTDQPSESSESQRSVTLRLKELLFSRPMLERVVTRFDLYPEVRKRYGMVDAVEELKKHIDFRSPGGDTFSIAFEGRSAREAQAVTTELSRQIIDGDAELRKRQSKAALDFLVGERQAREAELRQNEEELASFMAQHPRFALDATPLANGAAIRATMSGEASPSLAPARPTWSPRPREAAATGQGAPVAAAPAPASPEAIQEESRARAALAAARENLTAKLARYTPAHPDVRAAEAEVQRATERLAQLSAAAPKPVVAAAPAEAPAAAPVPAPRPVAVAPRAAVAPVAPTAPSPAASSGSKGLVELETEWLKLTRAVTEARQRLDQIESQLFRAAIVASSATGGFGVTVNVIDPAFLPQTPLPPGRLTLAAIFLVGSLLLGAVGAMLYAVFDERIFTERELGAVSEVLVSVPKSSMRRANVAS